MTLSYSRRRFIQTAAAGSAVLGLGDLAFLNSLRPVSAADAKLDPNVVKLDPGIEPLVRLIETTPRDRLLEEVGTRVRTGLSYRDLLAALLLAGVRNVEPRPSVGFKFHSVLVVNSAHLASLSSPDSDRWLPIFWALDYFKSAQAQDERERNWTMAPVDESKLPAARGAKGMFTEAMDNWDVAASDVAIAQLARSSGANEVFELFFRLGARDFRSIGHKAIYVANSCRTLQCIGWHHAEPVLRSLAYALLMHEGDNPAKRDDAADRPWRRNVQLAQKINDDWRGGKLSSDASRDLLVILREGSADAACDKVVELLNKGTSPQSIWDALFDASGELLLRQAGIVSLHAVTTTNALHYAFAASGDDMTRRLMMLQNAAFVTLFRDSLARRGTVAEARVDALEPAKFAAKGEAALEEIFAEVGRDAGKRRAAVGKMLAYLKAGGDAKAAIDTARRFVFLKGNDAHDYKFSSAVLEDYQHISPAWRDAYLSSSLMLLNGAGEADNGLIKRTRAALG
ncbi:MAG: hypothetical protein WD768_00090 [Phycisphaeraceae bacterium]